MSTDDFPSHVVHSSIPHYVGDAGADRVAWVWWQGPCECGVCGRSWRAVVEIESVFDSPVVALECPECGHMAGHPA